MTARQGRNAEGALDALARRLANGMSRREALRAGGAAFVGAVAISPSDVWAAATGKCPHHRVHCAGKCCPSGEVCLPPRHKGGKHRCGCPAHTSRCGGRCVHLSSDASNCGHCGHKCGHGQHCAGGHCKCPAGQAICSGACVTLGHDPRNCGACGHACPAGQVCSGGTCTLECAAGLTNCGGACVDLNGSHEHCGSCATTCGSDHVCTSGQCSCPAGQTSCSGACVALATNHANCGTCGHACNSVEVCSSGTCQSNCAAGETECNGSCVNTSTNVFNCGGCGQQCDTVRSNGASCSGGACLYTGCKAGFGDCDMAAPNLDGCETALNTVLNCGACHAACDTTHSIGAACTGTTCTYTGCASGFGDCNMAAPNLNGCETALNTVSNCGGCGRACSSSHVAQLQCAFGVCISTCQSGFVNCSTPNAPTPDDGCECAGTACCSGACQTAHTNGLGQNFYDCAALDTYNVNQATEACNAYTGGGTCAGFNSGTGMNTLMSVCKPATDPTGASGVCSCWAYSGTGNTASAVGHVYKSSGTGGDTGCLAPTSTSLTWT